MEEPVRILSDLHLGHKASLAREITQVEPLYRGARTVVFNGDTIEMRSRRCRERAATILREVEAFCRAQTARTHFINGNHDPIISEVNHLELGEGSLLVTHGDVLFHEPDATPRATTPSERGTEELSSRELEQLARILSTNKRVSSEIRTEHFTIPDGTWGQFSTFMKQTWPPRRLVRTVSSWRNTHLHAMDLVRTYRPSTRCVIVGHTHRPGVWHNHGCTVINTGSYLPMLGRFAVDFEADTVTVRKVVFRRQRFHMGHTVARFRINGRVHAL